MTDRARRREGRETQPDRQTNSLRPVLRNNLTLSKPVWRTLTRLGIRNQSTAFPLPTVLSGFCLFACLPVILYVYCLLGTDSSSSSSSSSLSFPDSSHLATMGTN